MARSLLALGSNLGNRSQLLREACHAIGRLPQTQLLSRSRWHETAPIGGPAGQQPFLNGAVVVQTNLEPLQLVEHLLCIESNLGRLRKVRWDARIIDIDLLLYDARMIHLANLTLPHPRMMFRRFVLQPAQEIAGSWYHPVVGRTLTHLLRQLDYQPQVLRINSTDRAIAEWLRNRIASFFELVRSQKTHVGTFTLPKVWVGEPLDTLGGDQELELVHDAQDALLPFVTIELLVRTSGEMVRSSGDEPCREKKTEKFFCGKSVHFDLDCWAGPRLDIYAQDRELIEQEALAALQSAWPDVFAISSQENSLR